LRSVGVGGRISLIGVLAGTGDVNHTQILIKSIDVQGIYVGSRKCLPMNHDALHQIKPVVDRVFPFSETKEAYRHLQSGAHYRDSTLDYQTGN